MGYLLLGMVAGRCRIWQRPNDIPLGSRSNRIAPALARQSGLTAACLVVEIENFEFIFPRWFDCQIGVGPPVGRRSDFV